MSYILAAEVLLTPNSCYGWKLKQDPHFNPSELINFWPSNFVLYTTVFLSEAVDDNILIFKVQFMCKHVTSSSFFLPQWLGSFLFEIWHLGGEWFFSSTSSYARFAFSLVLICLRSIKLWLPICLHLTATVTSGYFPNEVASFKKKKQIKNYPQNYALCKLTNWFVFSLNYRFTE